MKNLEMWVCLVYLTGCSIYDLKYKRIGFLWSVIFGTAAIALAVYNRHFLFMLTGIIPGAVILIFSMIFKGRIGMGDAICLAVVGVYMGAWNTIIVMLLGCLLTSVIGGMLILFKKISIKCELPFSPFLLGSFVFMLITGGGL